MVTIISEYKSPSEFAKDYKGKFGTREKVSRHQITKLINKEISKPGTTGIDVIIVGTDRFVKHSTKKPNTSPQQQADELIRSIITKVGS